MHESIPYGVYGEYHTSGLGHNRGTTIVPCSYVGYHTSLLAVVTNESNITKRCKLKNVSLKSEDNTALLRNTAYKNPM